MSTVYQYASMSHKPPWHLPAHHWHAPERFLLTWNLLSVRSVLKRWEGNQSRSLSSWGEVEVATWYPFNERTTSWWLGQTNRIIVFEVRRWECLKYIIGLWSWSNHHHVPHGFTKTSVTNILCQNWQACLHLMLGRTKHFHQGHRLVIVGNPGGRMVWSPRPACTSKNHCIE